MTQQLNSDQINRYKRHLLLPEVGETGQQELLDARVLLLGAGGLGSPAALYLAAAGVGTLGIIDMDVVDASNLQRQILHNVDRIGDRKVDSAKKTLTLLNPDVNVVTYDVRLDASNVLDILAGYDVVVDGTDNFPTRFMVNDASVKLGVPVVLAYPRTAAAQAFGALAGDLAGFSFEVADPADQVRSRFFRVFGSRKHSAAKPERKGIAV